MTKFLPSRLAVASVLQERPCCRKRWPGALPFSSGTMPDPRSLASLTADVRGAGAIARSGGRVFGCGASTHLPDDEHRCERSNGPEDGEIPAVHLSLLVAGARENSIVQS